MSGVLGGQVFLNAKCLVLASLGEPAPRHRTAACNSASLAQGCRGFWEVRFFLNSEGEKPPKIRKKKFPGTKFLGTFGPPPTEKTEKIGKIKGTLVRKVPGNLRSQELVFFSWAVFLPPINASVPLSKRPVCGVSNLAKARPWRWGCYGMSVAAASAA